MIGLNDISDFLTGRDTYGADPQTSATINQALKSYYRYKLMSDLAEGITSKITGGSNPLEGLQEKSLRLDIAQKKRQLGLPQDSDEFQDMENEGVRPGTYAQFAVAGANLIPDPSVPKTKKFGLFPSFAEGGTTGERSIIGTILGGTHGGSGRSIRDVIRRRL